MLEMQEGVKWSMKIAVLFDGAGLARLGLEQAGHECTGVEICPKKHHLSKMVGSGNSVLADATRFDLRGFDAVWASPPCQAHSGLTAGIGNLKKDGWLLYWAKALDFPVFWVENVMGAKGFGKAYNAAQFLETPVQNRTRKMGGRFIEPRVHRPYSNTTPNVPTAVLASEWKQYGSPGTRSASRFYGRMLTLEEAAYHQGFTIPPAWHIRPATFTEREWKINMYEAIGNGVPVYMAKAFGAAYPLSEYPN